MTSWMNSPTFVPNPSRLLVGVLLHVRGDFRRHRSFPGCWRRWCRSYRPNLLSIFVYLLTSSSSASRLEVSENSVASLSAKVCVNSERVNVQACSVTTSDDIAFEPSMDRMQSLISVNPNAAHGSSSGYISKANFRIRLFCRADEKYQVCGKYSQARCCLSRSLSAMCRSRFMWLLMRTVSLHCGQTFKMKIRVRVVRLPRSPRSQLLSYSAQSDNRRSPSWLSMSRAR